MNGRGKVAIRFITYDLGLIRMFNANENGFVHCTIELHLSMKEKIIDVKS